VPCHCLLAMSLEVLNSLSSGRQLGTSCYYLLLVARASRHLDLAVCRDISLLQALAANRVYSPSC